MSVVRRAIVLGLTEELSVPGRFRMWSGLDCTDVRDEEKWRPCFFVSLGENVVLRVIARREHLEVWWDYVVVADRLEYANPNILDCLQTILDTVCGWPQYREES